MRRIRKAPASCSPPIGIGSTPAAARRDYVNVVRGKVVELTADYSDESGFAIQMPKTFGPANFECLRLPARPRFGK